MSKYCKLTEFPWSAYWLFLSWLDLGVCLDATVLRVSYILPWFLQLVCPRLLPIPEEKKLFMYKTQTTIDEIIRYKGWFQNKALYFHGNKRSTITPLDKARFKLEKKLYSYTVTLIDYAFITDTKQEPTCHAHKNWHQQRWPSFFTDDIVVRKKSIFHWPDSYSSFSQLISVLTQIPVTTCWNTLPTA